ncbi:MAG: DCC1-like thiol-disulfide oxidoreductase family protein [Myxococcales bacterium]|nr:DCC1-like thiol-disulfide oxidoreductase family protein [Myxococcales bacterium]
MTPELLLYDGHCGLCHGAVRFVLARDPSGEAFRFAPLGGAAFEAAVPEALRESLPDSMAVVTHDGELLLKSDAAVHVLRRLGGGWKWLGGAIAAVPTAVRDSVYDFVARRRKQWFGEVDESCPIVPAALRTRFDA